MNVILHPRPSLSAPLGLVVTARPPKPRAGALLNGVTRGNHSLLAIFLVVWNTCLHLAAVAAPTASGEEAVRKALDAQPNWEVVSRRLISYNDAIGSGLKKMPFPDLNNPLHVRIWNALKVEHKVGDGFGTICDYFGAYLINISVNESLVASYFYETTSGSICNADTIDAFMRYKGNKNATITNVTELVCKLLAVTGEDSTIVTSADDIPHKRWRRNHPNESFNRYLLAKGINLHGPEMLIGREDFDENGWQENSECNIFVYLSHGGRIVRYEVQCEKARIVGLKIYVLGGEIGDFWYTM